MVNVLGKNVYIDTNTFRNNKTIVNVDLCHIPFTNNSMDNAFYYCQNLTSVSHINQNVTNMYNTFAQCFKLNHISAIPNNVTNMASAFYMCTKIAEIPRLPNSVVDMSRTFEYCSSLVNTPNVPNSVSNMYRAFLNCYRLTDAPIIPDSVTNMDKTFSECYNLVNVQKISNNATTLHNTFYNCFNLVNVSAIPNSVTNMSHTFFNCTNLADTIDIANASSLTNMCYTFYNCSNFTNAPTIPNNVTDMSYTFLDCSGLVNPPDMNNSNNVTNMYWTFYYCNSLTNAPIIPNSVIDMSHTFMYCTNLTGNIYIHSNQVTNAMSCFGSSSLTKNVYIPFTYDNGVNTQTYNSFINAGYDTNGTNCGVYLKDLYPTQQYNITDYTYTLTGKTLTLESYTGSGGDIVVPTPIEPVTVTFNIDSENLSDLTAFEIDGVNYLGTIDSNNNISINLNEGEEYSLTWSSNYNSVRFTQDGVDIGDARGNSFTINGTTLTMNTTNGNGQPVVRTMDITKIIYCLFVEGGCCVTEDTEILYADGTTKLAKEVSVGDIVKGYNESSKEFVDVEVLQIRTPDRNSLIRITLDDDSYIDCTPEHPLYSENVWGSYDEKAARESYKNDIKTEIVHIDVGSKLLQPDGSYKTIKSIEELTVNGAIKTYTFDTTNGVDTYISNNCISHNHSG